MSRAAAILRLLIVFSLMMGTMGSFASPVMADDPPPVSETEGEGLPEDPIEEPTPTEEPALLTEEPTELPVETVAPTEESTDPTEESVVPTEVVETPVPEETTPPADEPTPEEVTPPVSALSSESSLVITTYGFDTGSVPVAGACYVAHYPNGEQVLGSASCDYSDGENDGVTHLPLSAGDYILVNWGYGGNGYDQMPDQTIEVTSGAPTELTVTLDRPMGTSQIQILTVDDSDPAQPVLNNCFQISADIYNSQYLGAACDSDDGVVDGSTLVRKLEPGLVTIFPATYLIGYALPPAVENLPIGQGMNPVTIVAARAANLTLNVVEAADGVTPIIGEWCFWLDREVIVEGVPSFQYASYGCDNSADVVAGGPDGVFTYSGLIPGTYQLSMANPAQGYLELASPVTTTVVLDTNNQVTIALNRAATFTVDNQDDAGEPIIGGCFYLYDLEMIDYSTGACIQPWSPDGQVLFDHVAPGSYFLVQGNDIPGYDRATPTQLELVAGSNDPVTMISPRSVPPATGDLIISWEDTDGNPLGEGCVHVYHNISNGLSEGYCGTEIELLNVPVGSYTVDETTAPAGYGLLEYGIDVTVNSGQTTFAKLVHEPSGPRGDLTFTVLNDLGAPLLDACYFITTVDDPDSWVSYGCDYINGDSDGVFEITGVPEGTYRLNEFSTPEGYATLPEQMVTVTANETTAYTFTYVPAQGQGYLTIEAVSGGELLVGACWRVTGTEGFNQLVCDSYGSYDGRAQFPYIPAGEYSIVATRGPVGHTPAAPSTVTIVSGQTQIVEIEHTAGSALSVITVGANGESISGACLQVFQDAGGGSAGTYVQLACDSDNPHDGALDGIVRTFGLPAGDYVYRVSYAPDGYLAPDGTFAFSVLPDGSVVTADGTGTVTAIFALAGGLIVNFVDGDGLPIPDELCFEVFLDAGNGERGGIVPSFGAYFCPGTFDPDGGTQRLEPLFLSNLGAGNYLLAIRPTGSIYTLNPEFAFTVSAGETQEVTVTLGADAPALAMGLEITVLDENGLLTSGVQAGQELTVIYTVTNRGTSDLTNGEVTSGTHETVAAFEIYEASWGPQQFSRSYLVTEADAAAGRIVFEAMLTADGLAPVGTSIEIVVVSPFALTADAGGPYAVDEGGSIILTGTGIEDGSGGQVLSYGWDLDNDGVFEESGETVEFSAVALDGPGTVAVTFQVCAGSGQCAVDETEVTISNVAPVIVGIATDGTMLEGSPVQVTVDAFDVSANDPLTYSIDCDDDGLFETGPVAETELTCTIADDGTYDLTVQVDDGDGGVVTDSVTVVIANVAPTVTIAGVTPLAEGSFFTLELDAIDPGADTITEWSIDWGDGATESISGGTTTATHIFDNGPVTYQVRASATDEDGTYAATPSRLRIRAQNVKPTATLEAPVDPQAVGESFQVTLTNAFDPSAADTAAGFAYSWDCGDGAGYGAWVADATITCLAVDPGTQRARGRIQDQDGGTTAYTANVVIVTLPELTGQADQIAVEGTNSAVTLGTLVDEDSRGPYAISVDWGDGTTALSYNRNNPGSLGSRNHRFVDNGTYTVTVTAADVDGNPVSASFLVTVSNLAPSINAPNDQTARVGVSKNIKLGAVVDPGSTDAPWSVTVNWGDGAAQTTLPVNSTGAIGAQPHSYAAAGTYTVTVTVTDKDGATGSSTFVVTVT